MKGTRMWGVAAIVALAAVGVDTGEARAQAAQLKDTEIQAQQLEREAYQLLNDIRHNRRASNLFRKAADVRGSDLASVEDLMMAGRLSFYDGREGQAIQDLTRAGETALEWGDVVAAATAFLDAAWVAHHDDRGTTAHNLVVRAQKLSQSPLIAQAARRDIEARIAAQQQQPQQ